MAVVEAVQIMAWVVRVVREAGAPAAQATLALALEGLTDSVEAGVAVRADIPPVPQMAAQVAQVAPASLSSATWALNKLLVVP
jgi:hypothetical protein